jgi:hypothetical protein
MHKDLVFGIAALAVAGGYYALAAGIPATRLADAIGPAGLPRLYAFVLAGLSLMLIARSVGRSSRAGQPRASPSAPISFSLPIAGLLLALGLAYVVVVPWAGYVPSIAGLIAATARAQGARVTRAFTLIAVGGAIFFWLLFVRLLGIPHPPGIWADLF